MVNSIEAVIKNQIDPFKLYNIGLGEAVSIKDMVQKIINISGKSLKVEHDLSKPSNKTAFCLDISKAQQELKWYPKIELEEDVWRKWEQLEDSPEARQMHSSEIIGSLCIFIGGDKCKSTLAYNEKTKEWLTADPIKLRIHKILCYKFY